MTFRAIIVGLLGWMLKTIISRMGGHRSYQNCKPLMIGIIAGEILGALVFMIHGAIYYFVTNVQPVTYRILPR